jgi:hypothetical protein
MSPHYLRTTQLLRRLFRPDTPMRSQPTVPAPVAPRPARLLLLLVAACAACGGSDAEPRPVLTPGEIVGCYEFSSSPDTNDSRFGELVWLDTTPPFDPSSHLDPAKNWHAVVTPAVYDDSSGFAAEGWAIVAPDTLTIAVSTTFFGHRFLLRPSPEGFHGTHELWTDVIIPDEERVLSPVFLNRTDCPLTMTRPGPPSTGLAFATEFFEWYQAPANGRSLQEVLRERPHAFDSKLLAALVADTVAASENPGLLVGLELDPYFATPCDRYVVAHLYKPSATRSLVALRDSCLPSDAVDVPIVAELTEVDGMWKFSDFLYPNRTRLLDILADYARQRSQPPKP